MKRFIRWITSHRYSTLDLILVCALGIHMFKHLSSMSAWDHIGLIAMVFVYFLVQSIVRAAVARG